MAKPIYHIKIVYTKERTNKNYKPNFLLKWFIGKDIPLVIFDNNGKRRLIKVEIGKVFKIPKSRSVEYFRFRDIIFLTIYRMRGKLKSGK